MKTLFLSEVRRELGKDSPISQSFVTYQDIAILPEPVKRYFHYCGYLNKEKMMNAEIKWGDFFLKLDPNKKWLKLKCFQFNSVLEPCRIVFMKSKIFGIFPFEGKDKYQDGHGNMLIKLLKFFKLDEVTGKEMDQGELVTVLAEALLIPTYSLQPYITWTSINNNACKAVIEFNNIKAEGTFYFNELGEFIRFETKDRYRSDKKHFKKVRWSAVASNYIEKNGIKFPSRLKGIWHMEKGDFEYFIGTINSIDYNTVMNDVY